MHNHKKDKKVELKPYLLMLKEVLRPPGPSPPEELDVRICTWDVVMRIKGCLGCIFFCLFLLFDWKTWNLKLLGEGVTIHFPRLLGLSIIEAGIVGLVQLRVHKYYKWGMRVAAGVIAVALCVDLRPELLDKSWLVPPIFVLWAAGILAFLLCMTWLFMYVRVDKVCILWAVATILMFLLCVFLLLSLLGGVTQIHPTLKTITFTIFMIVLICFVIVSTDAFLVAIFGKWG